MCFVDRAVRLGAFLLVNACRPIQLLTHMRPFSDLPRRAGGPGQSGQRGGGEPYFAHPFPVFAQNAASVSRFRSMPAIAPMLATITAGCTSR